MAITKMSNSGIATGGNLKYDDMLAGNPPYFPPPVSDYESIATVTATGSETTLTFTSIPQTYKHLQIRGLGRYAGNAFNFTIGLRIRFNGDTSNNYSWHRFTGDGASTSAVGYTATNGYWASSAAGGGVASNIYGAAIADILDYSSTTKLTTMLYYAGTEANAGSTSFETSIGGSAWYSSNAVTSVSIGFTDAGGTAAAGSTFALYGIRG